MDLESFGDDLTALVDRHCGTDADNLALAAGGMVGYAVMLYLAAKGIRPDKDLSGYVAKKMMGAMEEAASVVQRHVAKRN